MHAASIRTEYLDYKEHRNLNQLMHFFAHQMTIISAIDAMLKTGELEEIIENGRIKLRAMHQDI